MKHANVTPWYPFGSGARRCIRQPYLELQVFPTPAGWVWQVDRMDARSGRFVPVADGIRDSELSAKGDAMDAANDVR